MDDELEDSSNGSNDDYDNYEGLHYETDDDDADSDSYNDNADSDNSNSDSDNNLMEVTEGNTGDKSLIRLILIAFFNIVHHFRMSNHAASVIISFLHFILGNSTITVLLLVLIASLNSFTGLISHPVSAIFPKTLSGAIHETRVETVTKYEFIVCPNDHCYKLYKTGDHTTQCTNVMFGKVCGRSLGYEAQLSHGKKKWKAYKKFHFYPPSAWLKKFYSSKQFIDLIESNTCSESDFIADVCDGRIWKEFSATGFFSSKHNVGLMLNTDWFKPFKRSEYKVAAIMLTILNLPRKERFKKKWTIIAGNGHDHDSMNIIVILANLFDHI